MVRYSLYRVISELKNNCIIEIAISSFFTDSETFIDFKYSFINNCNEIKCVIK